MAGGGNFLRRGVAFDAKIDEKITKPEAATVERMQKTRYNNGGVSRHSKPRLKGEYIR